MDVLRATAQHILTKSPGRKFVEGNTPFIRHENCAREEVRISFKSTSHDYCRQCGNDKMIRQ